MVRTVLALSQHRRRQAVIGSFSLVGVLLLWVQGGAGGWGFVLTVLLAAAFGGVLMGESLVLARIANAAVESRVPKAVAELHDDVMTMRGELDALREEARKDRARVQALTEELQDVTRRSIPRDTAEACDLQKGAQTPRAVGPAV
jgi:hypothetical protein